jgi:hypothetical protein
MLLGLGERVPGLVKTVGNRPTGSSKEEKGTNPGTKQQGTRRINKHLHQYSEKHP